MDHAGVGDTGMPVAVLVRSGVGVGPVTGADTHPAIRPRMNKMSVSEDRRMVM